MRTLSDAELREGLTAALGVRRFVDDVASAGPYAALPELLEVASNAASKLSAAEVDEAMAHHPRIGETPVGEGAAQAFSRAEQSSGDADDTGLAIAIADGNRAYEARFGRVFLIRAAGRSRAEILAELTRRQRLDDEAERQIVGDELRQIALLRLRSLFGDDHAAESNGASV